MLLLLMHALASSGCVSSFLHQGPALPGAEAFSALELGPTKVEPGRSTFAVETSSDESASTTRKWSQSADLRGGMTNAGGVMFGHDALGSVVMRVPSSGAPARTAYDAWGAVRATPSTGPPVGATGDRVGFTGHSNEDTGLVYAQQRWLDPSTGRFLSLDPVAGALDEPLSTQGFTYGRSNPLRFTDPDGRFDNPVADSLGYLERQLRMISEVSVDFLTSTTKGAAVGLAGLACTASVGCATVVGIIGTVGLMTSGAPTAVAMEDQGLVAWRCMHGTATYEELLQCGEMEGGAPGAMVAVAATAESALLRPEAGVRRRIFQTGATLREELDAKAIAAYENIRTAGMRDVDAVAKNSGVDIEDLRKFKKHVFFDEHDLAFRFEDGIGIRHERFESDINIAEAWLEAREGPLTRTQQKYIKKLVIHEVKESELMAQGVPYRDIFVMDDDGYFDQGVSAHDFAPAPPGYWPAADE